MVVGVALNTGFEGTVGEVEWSKMQSAATAPWTDLTLTPVSGARALTISGQAYADGVLTTISTPIRVDFPAPTAQTIYYVFLRRDWSKPDQTDIIFNTTGARQYEPGNIADQVITRVMLQATNTTVFRRDAFKGDADEWRSLSTVNSLKSFRSVADANGALGGYGDIHRSDGVYQLQQGDHAPLVISGLGSPRAELGAWVGAASYATNGAAGYNWTRDATTLNRFVMPTFVAPSQPAVGLQVFDQSEDGGTVTYARAVDGSAGNTWHKGPLTRISRAQGYNATTYTMPPSDSRYLVYNATYSGLHGGLATVTYRVVIQRVVNGNVGGEVYVRHAGQEHRIDFHTNAMPGTDIIVSGTATFLSPGGTAPFAVECRIHPGSNGQPQHRMTSLSVENVS